MASYPGKVAEVRAESLRRVYPPFHGKLQDDLAQLLIPHRLEHQHKGPVL